MCFGVLVKSTFLPTMSSGSPCTHDAKFFIALYIIIRTKAHTSSPSLTRKVYVLPFPYSYQPNSVKVDSENPTEQKKESSWTSSQQGILLHEDLPKKEGSIVLHLSVHNDIQALYVCFSSLSFAFVLSWIIMNINLLCWFLRTSSILPNCFEFSIRITKIVKQSLTSKCCRTRHLIQTTFRLLFVLEQCSQLHLPQY